MITFPPLSPGASITILGYRGSHLSPFLPRLLLSNLATSTKQGVTEESVVFDLTLLYYLTQAAYELDFRSYSTTRS